MVYNAFPHFTNPQGLIDALAQTVKIGGRLSVAHSMSREDLMVHHKRAEEVSLILPEATELAKIFAHWFEIETIIFDNNMYQVVGIRKEE